jgi:hypothetical protein
MDQANKRFAMGILLAWTPWVPTFVGLIHIIMLSGNKATGLGVVTGGISEMLVILGLGAMVVSQVLAITWLCRSFSREHFARSLVSVISVILSALTLAIMGGYTWATWFLVRR